MRWLTNFLIGLIFLLSLLNFFPPPTMELWRISVLTREFGVFFVLVQGLLVLFALLKSSHGKESLVLAQMLMLVISVYLYIRPVYWAHAQAEDFSTELNQAFPNPRGSVKIQIDNLELFNPLLDSGPRPETLIFSEDPEFSLSLDYYRTESPEPKPLIVIFHGGGWQNGDNKQLSQVNYHLASLGYNVASVSYRFAPKYVWPAQQDDVFKALDFLFERAPLLGFDPNNVFTMGRSAGGQLAAIAGYKYKKKALRGVIMLYAPTDMMWGYELSEEIDMLESRKLLEEFLGGDPFKNEKTYTDASPIFFLDEAIPTLLFHGKPDPLTFYRHSDRLCNRLKSKNKPCAMIRMNWATHGFDFNAHGPGGQVLYQAIKHFVETQTQK